jgi:hypothetical protein
VYDVGKKAKMLRLSYRIDIGIPSGYFYFDATLSRGVLRPSKNGGKKDHRGKLQLGKNLGNFLIRLLVKSGLQLRRPSILQGPPGTVQEKETFPPSINSAVSCCIKHKKSSNRPGLD